MKIELKNIKYLPSLSHETFCYSASIYIDGKKEGFAENHGCGGSTFYRFDQRETEQRFEAHTKGKGEFVLDKLVADYLCKKEKQNVRKKIAQYAKKSLSNGFPITISVHGENETLFQAMRREDQIPGITEKLAAKIGKGSKPIKVTRWINGKEIEN